MKKLLLILFVFIGLNVFAQSITETTLLSNYPRHDTTVTITLTADYDWIAYFTFTNANNKGDTVYIDISGKVNSGTTYSLINSDTLIYSDTVAIIKAKHYTCEMDNLKYEGIWNYLRFRVRTNAASDEKVYLYFRKKAE
jgi:hypothetical protein